MSIIRIDSEHDDRLANFRHVPEPELLVRRGLFVAEGRFVVERLLASQLETRALLVTETALASLQSLPGERSFPVFVVAQAVMNDVAGFNFHRGCLALGVRPRAQDWREIVRASAGSKEQDPAHVLANQDPAYGPQDPACEPRRIVALERIGNVDNVGSIFRSAAALGVDGVLLQTDCADPLYRKAIRTSMAATLTMPHARVPWPDALQELAANGWATVAMTTAGDSPTIRDIAKTLAGHKVAIVLGHEGDGLTADAVRACSHRARIAMRNGIDSLNVAIAAAIALYEMGW